MATTTTTVTLSTSAYTDLGAGPMYLSASGGGVIYQIADSLPSPASAGDVVQPGEPPAEIQTTAHVWAIAPTAGVKAVVSSGTGISFGGSGGGASSSPTVTSVAVPTVTASSAYASGNEVGGLLTFAGVPTAGVLQSAHIKLASVQSGEFDLYLFTSNPSNSTWTDKTSPSINAADVTKLIGVLQFTNNLSGLGVHTIYEQTSIGKAMAPGATTIYGVLVTKGTPTFASTSDILGVTLAFLPG